MLDKCVKKVSQISILETAPIYLPYCTRPPYSFSFLHFLLLTSSRQLPVVVKNIKTKHMMQMTTTPNAHCTLPTIVVAQNSIHFFIEMVNYIGVVESILELTVTACCAIASFLFFRGSTALYRFIYFMLYGQVTMTELCGRKKVGDNVNGTVCFSFSYLNSKRS